MVSQTQEKYVNAGLSGITKVSVDGPTSGKLLLAHLSRSKVVSDYSFHQLYLFDTKPQPFQYING
jgi:hypothetical protein